MKRNQRPDTPWCVKHRMHTVHEVKLKRPWQPRTRDTVRLYVSAEDVFERRGSMPHTPQRLWLTQGSN